MEGVEVMDGDRGWAADGGGDVDVDESGTCGT